MKHQIKNLITTCALVLLLAIDARAAEAGLSIVPVVGANSFNFHGSGMDSRSGIHAGADVLIPTSIQGLSFETGLNYLETGAKTEMFFASTEISLGYLAIPLLANWQFYKASSGTEWFLKGGTYLTQLMSAKQKTQVFGNSQETDFKDQMSNNDLMFTAGIGGRWTVFSNLLVAVDFDYAKGMMNTAKNVDGKSEGWILDTSVIIPL
ncbi:MAG: outer membrane beta-barrel protein [Pseudobdellovibrionaceae bacterium]